MWSVSQLPPPRVGIAFEPRRQQQIASVLKRLFPGGASAKVFIASRHGDLRRGVGGAHGGVHIIRVVGKTVLGHVFGEEFFG